MSITHGSVALTPDLSFSLNGVVVSTLQSDEAFGMANGFIDGAAPHPLLDWLMERSEAIVSEVEKMNRITDSLSGGTRERRHVAPGARVEHGGTEGTVAPKKMTKKRKGT